MNKRIRNIVIVVMAVSLIVGVPLTIISHSISLYETIEKNNVKINYDTSYRYTAYVNKSIIYYGREVIGMDEPLYIPLTRILEFNMFFDTSSPVNDIIENKGIIDLRIKLSEPNGWSILLNNTTFLLNSTSTSLNFSINVSMLREIISDIRKEIGSSSLEYYVEIDPSIKVSTRLNTRTVDRIIEPKLVLTLDFQRNKILYDNLNFTDSYRKVDKQVVSKTISLLGLVFSVQDLRYVSYAIIFAGVASAVFAMVTREKSLTNIVETLIHKYDNVIIKATTITSSSRKVLVKDFRELLRISRLLGKPIVYYKEGDSHVFTVIDAETLYVLSLNDEGKPIVN